MLNGSGLCPPGVGRRRGTNGSLEVLYEVGLIGVSQFERDD